jgi:outer membrane receptor for ferrienterochelin and colicin
MINAYKGYYTNIGKASIRGVEVEGTYANGPWDFRLAYTYTDGENRTPGVLYGKPLPNRPKDAVTARLTRQISEAVSAFVQVDYVGENWFDETALLAYEDLTTVDLGVKWALSGGHRLSLGVRDLFDESADRVLISTAGGIQQSQGVWYPDPGRTFYASYLWTF